MQLTDCGCNNPCTNCQQVAPTPCVKDKCRKSLETTKIAQLVWLQGLDENLCERFQRLADVVGLRDCAGNRVALETPVVLCSDFKAQLCAALTGLASGGEAVPGVTQLVGNDCKVYTVPAAGEVVETPNAVIDTSTIDFTATGTLNRTISGSVKVSADVGNILETHTDGLFVPEQPSSPTACQQIASFPFSGEAVTGTVLVGADCTKYVFPDIPVPGFTINDTSSVDLVLTGTVLEANVRLDPDFIGRITADGLELTCADVLVCAPAVTVLDTLSVNMSLVGQQVSADIIIDPDPLNALSVRPAGVFVDVCSALDNGNPAVPAVVGVTVLVGADCNRYTLPTPIPVSGSNTPTANTSVVGNTVQVTVNLDPSNELITLPGQGLAVTCEDVQDCVFGITNNFWTYNDIANSVAFNPSGDAGNQIGLGSDGRPYVAANSLTTANTDCLSPVITAGVLTVNPIISPAVGNSLLCTNDGLFAPTGPNVTITGLITNCISTFIAEGPTNTFQISVYPIISSDAGNVLECRATGLYSPAAPVLAGDVCSALSPALFGLVLGSDVLGNPEWQNPDRTDLSVGAVTLNEINDAVNRDSVFWISGNIVLPTPTDRCSRFDIHLKNVSGSSVTVTSASLIDGQPLITLDGTVSGGYPFGGDGGESVHLYYSFSLATWKVL